MYNMKVFVKYIPTDTTTMYNNVVSITRVLEDNKLMYRLTFADGQTASFYNHNVIITIEA